MATFKGVNKTIIDSITPATILCPGLQGGNVRVMLDYYTALGTEVATDTIEMCDELPIGAKIVEVIIENNDATTVLDVGDAEVNNRYINDATVAAITRINVLTGLYYTVDMTTAATPDNQILLTVRTATLTAGSVIGLAVFYTVE